MIDEAVTLLRKRPLYERAPRRTYVCTLCRAQHVVSTKITEAYVHSLQHKSYLMHLGCWV